MDSGPGKRRPSLLRQLERSIKFPRASQDDNSRLEPISSGYELDIDDQLGQDDPYNVVGGPTGRLLPSTTTSKSTSTKPPNTMMKSDEKPIYHGAQINAVESVLALLHLSQKHNLTNSALSDVIDVVRLHTPRGADIEHLRSLYYLKKSFGMEKGGDIVLHHVCENCSFLYEDDTLVVCPFEGCNKYPRYRDREKKTPHRFFIEVGVEEQIRDFFLDAEFVKDLGHRSKNAGSDGLSDVHDGALYKSIMGRETIRKHDLSVTWHMDGASVFKSSNFEIWPFQGVINELPPQKRFSKQTVLLMGLWFGRGKPCLATYMRPLATTLNRFQTEGITVKNASGELIVCRIFPLMFTMDLPAMAMAKDIVLFNGEYGCGMCEESGKSVASGRGYARAFPCPTDVGSIQRRSKERMMQQATEATGKKKVKGVKGFSPLLLIHNFDPGTQVLVDYLHGVCIGVMKDLLSYWVDGKFKAELFWIGDKLEELDAKLMQIRPPDFITRTPRSIQNERVNFKASEYRHLLLLYGPHILHTLLPAEYYLHFIMLSRGIYLLTKTHITPDELEEARQLLLQFYSLMSGYYGERSCRLNHHNTGLHLVECVKAAGPLWTFSTFGFESFCGEYIRRIHGTQHIALQIVTAFQSVQKLRMSSRLLNISNEDIKAFIFGTNRGKEQLEGRFWRLGALTSCTLEQPFLQAVAKEMPSILNDTTVQVFKRLEENGILYTCQEERPQKRQNSVVAYQKGTVKYGLIKLFVTVPSASGFLNMVVLSPFIPDDQQGWLAAIDDNSLSGHSIPRDVFKNQAMPVRLSSSNLIAVPISALREKLLFLGHDNDHECGVLVKFPNWFEHD